MTETIIGSLALDIAIVGTVFLVLIVIGSVLKRGKGEEEGE